MGIELRKELLAIIVPPMNQIAPFVVLILPDEAARELLPQQLPILPVGPPVLRAVPTLLQNLVAPLVIGKFLCGAVVIFCFCGLLFVVVMIDCSAAALGIDVDGLPVRVPI